MANTFLPKFGKWFLNFRPVLSLYCLSRAKEDVGLHWLVSTMAFGKLLMTRNWSFGITRVVGCL